VSPTQLRDRDDRRGYGGTSPRDHDDRYVSGEYGDGGEYGGSRGGYESEGYVGRPSHGDAERPPVRCTSPAREHNDFNYRVRDLTDLREGRALLRKHSQLIIASSSKAAEKTAKLDKVHRKKAAAQEEEDTAEFVKALSLGQIFDLASKAVRLPCRHDHLSGNVDHLLSDLQGVPEGNPISMSSYRHGSEGITAADLMRTRGAPVQDSPSATVNRTQALQQTVVTEEEENGRDGEDKSHDTEASLRYYDESASFLRTIHNNVIPANRLQAEGPLLGYEAAQLGGDESLAQVCCI
jgi:hypothetical protein